MDIIRARVALRHRKLSDVLDLALRFVMVHWKVYARVALIALVPGVFATWGILKLSDGSWAWAWTFAITWSLFAQIPFTVLASRLVFEDRVRAREAISASLHDIPRVLGLRILTIAALSLGFLLLFVPAAWVAVIFCFSTEVLILERSGIGGTLGRSQRVAQSDFGESLLMVIVVLLSYAAGVLLAEQGGRTIIEDLLQFRGPASMWTEGGSVLAVIGLLAAVPYIATARFLTYLNIRTRAEGWDIQTRFAALSTRAEETMKEAA